MRANIKTHIDFETERAYRGPELRPHYILETFNIEGHALVAFQGPCDVATDKLVDWEDRLAKDHIRAKSMIHVLGEFFQVPLIEGVWMQRLFAATVYSVLRDSLVGQSAQVTRSGDDIFVNDKKLSVSIVAPSPASCVFHFGINIDPLGAPVQAIGLQELNVKPRQLIEQVFTQFEAEWASISRACVKVRPVL